MSRADWNERIRGLDDGGALGHAIAGEGESLAPPYFGWYWRDVDFDADHVWLSDGGAEGEPEWWRQTLEARMGHRWEDPGVRFDCAQKWGYPRIKVEGEEWDTLRGAIDAHLDEPTPDGLRALTAFMNGLRAESPR